MKWKKLFHIYSAAGDYEWRFTHAANPFAEWIDEHLLLVYFTCRDKHNRSYISALKLNAKNNFAIQSVAQRPLLTPGQPGLFDDSGTAMGYLLPINGTRYLYYLGWNLKVTVPWQNSIGLAIQKATDEHQYPIFEKFSLAPIMDRSSEDPFSISYPSIMYEHPIYKMWYGSNLSWGPSEQEMKHVFKYAESLDAIHWQRKDIIILNHIHPNEFALSKPFVIKENNIYKMWYSYRWSGNIQTYRIGYAESKDGINWIRKDDEAGIDVSKNGWDSEMICYPFIFDYNGNRYMLYNGNGYGKTGFGVAVLEQH